MRLGPGTRLGPYEIVAPVAAGGMGEVYRGRDPRLKRDIAIKILQSADPQWVRQFEQEAQAASRLNHPNILAVYDVGVADGVPYLITELLGGETIRAKLETTTLTPADALKFAIQIAHGLAAAHARDIVHRDLKPENLWRARSRVAIASWAHSDPKLKVMRGDPRFESLMRRMAVSIPH